MPFWIIKMAHLAMSMKPSNQCLRRKQNPSVAGKGVHNTANDEVIFIARGLGMTISLNTCLDLHFFGNRTRILSITGKYGTPQSHLSRGQLLFNLHGCKGIAEVRMKTSLRSEEAWQLQAWVSWLALNFCSWASKGMCSEMLTTSDTKCIQAVNGDWPNNHLVLPFCLTRTA